MVETSKKQRKGSISEEDISTLLQRYSVTTVLTLLQEVEKVAGKKIDWNAIAKNTATEISSARECQMLWRHLAYGQTLTDQIEDAANTMDDDSDLEYEMEAFPAVNRETSVEAVACVKVLIASDSPIDSHLPNNSTIEAPLIINIPKVKAVTAPSDNSPLANATQGTNICIPVSVQKQPLSSGTCGEKRPNNGTLVGNFPPRRKRRGWSAEDDVKLTAAVQKYGERNWANIAKGDFMNDRKASELSQRWANLRKKQGNLNVGTSSQPSEEKLAATHYALNRALDNMPVSTGLKIDVIFYLSLDGQYPNEEVCLMPAINVVGTKSQPQSLKASASAPDLQFGTAGPPKSQLPTQRPSTKPTTHPDPMVKAAAVFAGARIADGADASSIIEATTRSQNVVHITTGGNSGMKSSTISKTNQLPSNVHFIANGLSKAPFIGHAPVQRISEDQSAPSGNQSKVKVDKHQISASGKALRGNAKGDSASISFSDPISQTQDDRVALPCSEVEDNGKKNADNVHTSKGNHENPSPNVRQENLLSMSIVESGEASTRSTTAPQLESEENK
ncbi:hypothetical protein DH2020_044361 [Rehmannia glutinosa]|uniref:Uncharacterized protein n=1 Tax=Rehmannia glutinosa TaxID=99300 RepID=A0ABR0UI96_REHGL